MSSVDARTVVSLKPASNRTARRRQANWSDSIDAYGAAALALLLLASEEKRIRHAGLPTIHRELKQRGVDHTSARLNDLWEEHPRLFPALSSRRRGAKVYARTRPLLLIHPFVP